MNDQEKHDIAHDQEVYAFESENNLGLLDERKERDQIAVDAWSWGFEAGWRRAKEVYSGGL